MGKNLTPNDFYEIVGTKSGILPRTMKNIMKNMLDLIISELQNNGYITIENLGKFKVVQKGGRDEWFTNEYGFQEKRYVEPFDFVEFEPSRNFINGVNGALIDKGANERLKKDALTSYDKILLGMEVQPTTEQIIFDLLNKKEQRKNKK